MNAAGLLDLAFGQFIFWFVLEIWEHEARSSTGLWQYSILTFKDFFYFSTLVLRLTGERRRSLLSTQSSRNQKKDFTTVNQKWFYACKCLHCHSWRGKLRLSCTNSHGMSAGTETGTIPFNSQLMEQYCHLSSVRLCLSSEQLRKGNVQWLLAHLLKLPGCAGVRGELSMYATPGQHAIWQLIADCHQLPGI